MDFDDAKENIQPLPQGRNASILQASLRVDSSQELLAQRKELEKEIHNYSGDDPLSVWYNYIEWIEQSFPSGGKESGLQEVLSKCLAKFESDERYNQDRRMIKLYIKFIDSHKDPAECYNQLFNAGIGTMVADFYIAWAYCYDLVGNNRKADEIFRRGIACRAQPLEDLQEAHQHFGFSVAQRLIYKDDENIKEETNRQLNERRLALTSLRGHRRKQMVGSIRTGAAVKSFMPGTVKNEQASTSSNRSNLRVQVFADENETANILTTSSESKSSTETGKSVVRTIIDAARDQENLKEPGPWNKAHICKKGKLFGKKTVTNELGFEIHEDEVDEKDIEKKCIPPIPIADHELKFDKPFKYPTNFCAKSKPIKGWITPVTTEEMPDKNTIPEYNKCKLYPRPNMEFQPEELMAYNLLRKRNIENSFTKERDLYWGIGPNYNIRLYPHFVKQSKSQKREAMDEPFIPEEVPGLLIPFNEIYNKKEKVERQFEEILALRIKWNRTIVTTTDMEETMCTTSEKVQRRKSFFPLRKSLAPSAFKISNRMTVIPDQSEDDKSISIPSKTEVGKPKLDIKTIEGNNADLSKTPQIFNTIIKPTVHEEENSSISQQKPSEIKLHSQLAVEKIQKEILTNKPFEIYIDETANEKENSPISQQKPSEIESPSQLTTEKAQKEILSNKPFEIYVDESVVEIKNYSSPPTATSENDFQFKTPALPIANSTTVPAASNKLPFEIYDEENLVNNNANTISKTDFGCGTGGFFDPEETCSTQTFNIFLKAQSVSTPKATIKSQPQRQFGNILKEVSKPTIAEQKDDHEQLTTTNDNVNYIAPGANTQAAAGYSPTRQQLSTILETSEHGTTQGTQSTAATTTSTVSSPEYDKDAYVQTTANIGPNQPPTALESRYETSNITSPNKLADKLTNSLKIHNVTNCNTSRPQNENLTTPSTIRIQKKCGLNFSIFEDSMEKHQQKVGNFSRLEEKEDTGAVAAFKPLPHIRFQDDKTETIPKLLITTQQVKFQEDKTETISMFAPAMPVQFEEDKTETISKMLLGPAQPIKFPEDKTETISKFMLVSPEANKYDRDESNKNHNIAKNQSEDGNHDPFELFGHTPPKAGKSIPSKQIDKKTLYHVRTAADTRTPISFDSKRFCDKETPDILKEKTLSKPNASFKNELSRKSFKSKSIFRDSFMPDFSLIEDSQPQTKQQQTSKEKHHKTISESILPDFSLIENTQPKPSTSIQDNPQCRSILADFSLIPETQPNESMIKSSQTMEPRILKPPSKKSIMQDNSLHWKETPNPKAIANKTQDGTSLKNILMDTFMKDFSEIKEPPPIPNDLKILSMVQSNNNNSTLRFLNETVNQKSENPNISKIANKHATQEDKLNFLASAPPANKSPIKEKKRSDGSDDDKYFELNCETEMFGTNISMIKNSTWLPNQEPFPKGNAKQLSQIQEQSLHIKSEEQSSNNCTLKSQQKSKLRFLDKSVNKDLSIEISASEWAAINAQQKSIKNSDNPIAILESPEYKDDAADDNCEMSIYYKQTPKTPKPQVHVWDDAEAFKTSSHNNYIHAEPNLNETHQIIENIGIDPNVNPFNVDLINAFLEQHYVISFLESLPTCKLVGCIQRLKQHATINIKGVNFEVIKLIAEGAYGAVFCGKETSSGKLVAMKQEKPPNYWEYYICLEIQERIRSDEMLPAYMSVDYALIGNNSSILISNYSNYGSLITVCNKIKKHTMKNVDEYVVMLLACELLEVIDHLHAVNIIHADVKADNFLLMNKLTYPPKERSLQLIDFGVSIDMKLFKEGQTFSFVHNDNAFKCPEMREERPWTFQLDLYGLAGVLHVLLFGKYMEIEKNARGFWMHKTHVPRYFNKNLWDDIFKNLLNIRDCNTMPNLQALRASLKKEMEEKEKYVVKMVVEFNRALSN